MRPPRHRFSDEVRSTTRSAAATMVREGSVARTPEQLSAWISSHPDAKRSLESDGYGSVFGSEDLFPLLQVFVEKSGGSMSAPVASKWGPTPAWIAAIALVVAVVLGVIIGILV